MIDDGGDSVVRADPQELRRELLAPPDIDGNGVIGKTAFLEHDRCFLAVRCGPVVQIDHGFLGQLRIDRLPKYQYFPLGTRISPSARDA